MTGMIGADVEGLLRLADAFNASARRLRDLSDSLSSQLKAAKWEGERADAARSQWFSHSAAVLSESADLLLASDQALRRNALEQAEASGEAEYGVRTGNPVPTPVAPSLTFHGITFPETWKDFGYLLTAFGRTPGKPLENPVSASDIHQGYLADCYLLAALGAMTMTVAGRLAIRDSVKHNADGSYTVIFPDQLGVEYRVTTMLLIDPKTGIPLYANPQGDLWPALIEKAWAQRLAMGDYEGIGWRNESEVFSAYGYKTEHHAPEDLDAATLRDLTLQGPVTVATYVRDDNGDGIMELSNQSQEKSGHALFVKRVYETDSGWRVVLQNPWGSNNRVTWPGSGPGGHNPNASIDVAYDDYLAMAANVTSAGAP